MSTKSWLKRAKEYINEKNFDEALDTCKQILEWEPENYTALVFLGLTYLNLKKEGLAEEAYSKATKLNPSQPLAYQGLCNLYSSTGSYQNLTETYTKLLEVYKEARLGPKVLEIIDKLLEIYSSEYINSEAYMNTLMLKLPESPLHESIKDLPELPTELKVLKLMKKYQEKYDENAIQKLYDSRRRRLTNDSLETIKRKVVIEVLEKSKLEEVYDRFFQITDKLSSEENLEIIQNYLNFLYKCINYNIPIDLPQRFSKMLELSEYCLQTGAQYFLPYQISLEYDNVLDIGDYNDSIIDYALALGDNSDFYNYLKLYKECRKGSQVDIDNLLKFKNSLNNSLFYLHTMSYLTYNSDLFDECQFFSSKLTEKVNNLKSSTNYNLDKVWESSQLSIANSYLKMERKFHQLSYPIFIRIIEISPSNIRALEGLSNYLMESNQFELALDHLNRGLEIDPNNSQLLSTLGWVYFNKKDFELAEKKLKQSIEINSNNGEVYYRLGRVYWAMGGSYSNDRSFAMTQWILSAKLNPSNSNTFLYLGKYYLQIENDIERSKKCFQKAITLKSSNLEAIQELYDLSLNQNDLEFSQGLVLLATQSVPQSSWGWLKLGFLQLNDKSYSEAITSFHSGLRLNNKQSILWEGLGEAYYYEGRFIASLKAFERGLSLNPKAYACSYYLAKINIKLGNYQTSIDSLTKLINDLNNDDDEESLKIYQLPVFKCMLNCYTYQSQEEYNLGLYGKMVDTIQLAFDLLQSILDINQGLELNWEICGDLIIMLRLVASYITPDNIKFIRFLHSKIIELIKLNEFNNIEDIRDDLDIIENLLQKSTHTQLDFVQICMLGGIVCYRYLILIYNQPTPEFISFYLYKIAFGYASTHYFQEININSNSNYLESSSKSIQLALKYNSDNYLYWNLLGLIYIKLNPKLSREAFTQSILRAPKNPLTYTNLGYLSLIQMDYDLANQMFIYSQRLEPEFVSAWLGQTLVAKSIKSTDLLELATHAFNINEGKSTQVYLEYSEAILLYSKTESNNLLSLDLLNSGMFAMSKYVELIQNKPLAYNLLSNYLERLEMNEKASIMLQIGIQQLNLDKSKKPISLTVSLMINYARILCNLERYSESIQMYLEAEALNLKRKDPENTYTQARNYLGLGLAYFYAGDLNNSFKQFDHALTLSSGDPILTTDTRLLLAQVVWALGRKQVAKEQLLECIRNQNQTLPILFGLCAVGILDQDSTLTTAALNEISKTSLEDRKKDYYGHLEYLSSCGQLIKNQFNLAKSSLTKAVYLYPNNPFHWARLGAFLNKVYPQLAYYTVTLIERALDNIQKLVNITPKEKSYLHQIQSESYLLLGEFKWAKLSAQKSLMILPNNLVSRRLLATSLILLNKDNINSNEGLSNTIKQLLSTNCINLNKEEIIGKFEGFSYSLKNLGDWDNNLLSLL